MIGTGSGVGVAYALSRSGLSVTEVPLVAANALAAGIGGGGASELRGLSLACGGGIEAGSRRGVYGDRLRDLVGASATGLHGEGGLIGTRLCVDVASVLSCARLVVAIIPLIGCDLVARGSAGELRCFALAYGSGGETGSGLWIHGDGLRDLVGAMSVACRHRQCGLISACGGVGVACALSCASLPVAEIPLIAAYTLSAGIGGGSAGELCGLANANAGGVETGCRLCIYHDLSGSCSGLGTHGSRAGVSACHG